MNPYTSLPRDRFWKLACASGHFSEAIQCLKKVETITSKDKISTFGSCFAQHIQKELKILNYNLLNISSGMPGFTLNSEFPRFSGLYGNLYTIKQILELFKLALNVLGYEKKFKETYWISSGSEGDQIVDPFRPFRYTTPFDTVKLYQDSIDLLAKDVRRLIIESDIFIITLGLTQQWVDLRSELSVFSHPGVIGGKTFRSESISNTVFYDSPIDQDLDNIKEVIELLSSCNPKLRIIFTVSPVPLTATFVNESILISNTKSKSQLRSVADFCVTNYKNCYYFPSYEIILNPSSNNVFFHPNLRTVTPAGIKFVMSQFLRFFSPLTASDLGPSSPSTTEVLCDEDVIYSFIAGR